MPSMRTAGWGTNARLARLSDTRASSAFASPSRTSGVKRSGGNRITSAIAGTPRRSASPPRISRTSFGRFFKTGSGSCKVRTSWGDRAPVRPRGHPRSAPGGSMEGFKVVTPLVPRFRDTDAMGHLNNAVYVTYFEVARTAYWKALTGDKDYQKVPFILAHTTIDFRSPAFVHETLLVGIR